jgi:prepilin-type N-terminal cleavage/methylation domain-containing protein
MMKDATAVLAKPGIRNEKAKSRKGFTLVELVIVIAVLAIIAAIAIPTVSNVITNANNAADQTTCQSVELALKTADSQIKAGTADDSLSEESTVTDVLTKSGIAVDDSGLPALKSGNSYGWKYSNGKIYVTGAPEGAADLDGNNTKLSEIFPS